MVASIEKNAQDIIEAGADVLVAGNAVFKALNPEQAIKKNQTDNLKLVTGQHHQSARTIEQ